MDGKQFNSDKSNGNSIWKSSNIVLSDNDFQRFSAKIYDICGIKLPASKKVMLASRLQKRLRALGIDNFRKYFEYVFSSEGRTRELILMVDVVSTNKTNFFREEPHFTLLSKTVLPEIITRLRKGSRRTLHVWSAGCSSGEEPYTIAMVVDDYLRGQPNIDYTILGTDICTKVLEKATNAIYANDLLEPIPAKFLQRYMLRGKAKLAGFHKVAPEIRKKITFTRLNFMDKYFDLQHKMDIIFCRNVIIYFDRPTQIKLFDKFHKQLVPSGYLFTGHSESLEGINDRMTRIAAATYQCVT